MLNSTTVWKSTARLKFFITYSNDIDAQSPGSFVGAAGAAKWALLVKTWVAAMQHPRYLRVGGRQVEINLLGFTPNPLEHPSSVHSGRQPATF